MRFSWCFALLLAASIGCARKEGIPTHVGSGVSMPPAIHEMSLPSAIGTTGGEPFLSSGRDGSLIMSWLESDESSKSAALKLARFSNGRWSDPATVVRRDDLVVNWADFPSVVEGSDGTLYAHWPQKRGSATYVSDIMLARSRDGGATWSAGSKLNDDVTEGEHGFVTLVPHGPVVSAVWLDGRNMTEGEDHEGQGDMTLRFANIANDGKISGIAELDARTCECCATAMAWTESGPVVAYRDRDVDERRDISVVRQRGASWTQPSSLHVDGWKIEGCPVNGPQIDARGRDVAVAWFTGAADEPRVYVAFSSDEGASFGKPTRIDAGKPTGRVDIVLLPDRHALVTWIEGTGNTSAVVARRIAPDGRSEPVLVVAHASSARGAGVPRAALIEGDVYVAWTEFLPSRRIRVARLDLKAKLRG